MADLNEISKGVIGGDSDAVLTLTKAALEARVPASEILDKGLIPGLQKVGDLFGEGEYFLPELIVSGEAVSAALELLAPRLSQEGAPAMGKFLIGTVQGDVHDLGKNIVVMMLQGNGWEVTDLGVDVSPEEFCSAIAREGYQIIGMSSLLTMTMPNAARTIETLKAAGLRDKVKVMVGGAPVTQSFADQIGADAYAKNAVEAVKQAKSLISS